MEVENNTSSDFYRILVRKLKHILAGLCSAEIAMALKLIENR